MTNANRTTKSATVKRLLRRAQGATVDEIMATTGWKPHSVRAFLSGIRKSNAQLNKAERPDGGIAYHLITKAEA